MGTIAEKLIYVNGTKSAIKTAIEAKGVTVGNATFREYATKIGEITTSSGETSGWQPDPLWTDIRDMYDNDPLASSYTYRAAYLIAATDTSTLLKSGSRYITSDGYDSGGLLSSDYTHTWDTSQDIEGSDETKTRWIKVYRSSSLTYPYNFNKTVLWVVYNLGTSIRGSDSGSAYKYFTGCSSLTLVELENKVTLIDDYAFIYCSSLFTVSAPYVTKIDIEAFKGCGNLTTITISDSTTNIGTRAFFGCIALSSINISEGATIATDAFLLCYALQPVITPEFVYNGTISQTGYNLSYGITIMLCGRNYDFELGLDMDNATTENYLEVVFRYNNMLYTVYPEYTSRGYFYTAATFNCPVDVYVADRAIISPNFVASPGHCGINFVLNKNYCAPINVLSISPIKTKWAIPTH